MNEPIGGSPARGNEPELEDGGASLGGLDWRTLQLVWPLSRKDRRENADELRALLGPIDLNDDEALYGALLKGLRSDPRVADWAIRPLVRKAGRKVVRRSLPWKVLEWLMKRVEDDDIESEVALLRAEDALFAPCTAERELHGIAKMLWERCAPPTASDDPADRLDGLPDDDSGAEPEDRWTDAVDRLATLLDDCAAPDVARAEEIQREAARLLEAAHAVERTREKEVESLRAELLKCLEAVNRAGELDAVLEAIGSANGASLASLQDLVEAIVEAACLCARARKELEDGDAELERLRAERAYQEVARCAQAMADAERRHDESSRRLHELAGEVVESVARESERRELGGSATADAPSDLPNDTTADPDVVAEGVGSGIDEPTNKAAAKGTQGASMAVDAECAAGSAGGDGTPDEVPIPGTEAAPADAAPIAQPAEQWDDDPERSSDKPKHGDDACSSDGEVEDKEDAAPTSSAEDALQGPAGGLSPADVDLRLAALIDDDEIVLATHLSELASERGLTPGAPCEVLRALAAARLVETPHMPPCSEVRDLIAAAAGKLSEIEAGGQVADVERARMLVIAALLQPALLGVDTGARTQIGTISTTGKLSAVSLLQVELAGLDYAFHPGLSDIAAYCGARREARSPAVKEALSAWQRGACNASCMHPPTAFILQRLAGPEGTIGKVVEALLADDPAQNRLLADLLDAYELGSEAALKRLVEEEEKASGRPPRDKIHGRALDWICRRLREGFELLAECQEAMASERSGQDDHRWADIDRRLGILRRSADDVLQRLVTEDTRDLDGAAIRCLRRSVEAFRKLLDGVVDGGGPRRLSKLFEEPLLRLPGNSQARVPDADDPAFDAERADQRERLFHALMDPDALSPNLIDAFDHRLDEGAILAARDLLPVIPSRLIDDPLDPGLKA